jgi:hypothetical protein
MKNQKGVTLTTLTIYIIVATILLGTLTFININFMSELGELTKKSKMTNEIMKFYSYFVSDVKNAERILEFSENYVKFDSGIQYSIKYSTDEKKENGQEYDIYEVYRGNALVTDKLSGVFFKYNVENECINVKVYSKDGDITKTDEQYFKIGRGY